MLILIRKLDRRPVGSQGQKARYAEFKCECGTVIEIPYNRGKTQKTCMDCYGEQHGMADSPLYRIWAGIKRRCYNKNQKSYKYYGAKGVTMCDEWKNSFLAFHDWAHSNNWEQGLEVSRRGDAGNYDPLNCKIITKYDNLREKKPHEVTVDIKLKYAMTVTGLSLDEINEVVDKACSGNFKSYELADMYGVERHTITRWVKLFGKKPDYKQAYTEEDASEMCEAYATGLFTTKQIADYHRINQSVVSRMMKKHGIIKGEYPQ